MFTLKNITARLTEANLASKNDIANFDNKVKDVTSNKKNYMNYQKKLKLNQQKD